MILGISAYYHDSAAATLGSDGEILAAVQEERFSRIKNDAAFPIQSIRYCLAEAGCSVTDLERIVFYEKPFLKFDRILETFLGVAPFGFDLFEKALPIWMKQKLFLKQLLNEELCKIVGTSDRATRAKINSLLAFSDHHLSHAASAFYPSPFDEAAVLVLDGVGEWATASLFSGKGRSLKLLRELRFPHSLGLLYSAFTDYCGFKVNSGEYKLMGLAPYGQPIYADLIKTHLIRIREDGSFRLNMDYFGFCSSLQMTNQKFAGLFGGHPRKKDDPIEQRHKDLAASIQKITEEILIRMSREIARGTGEKNICLAGGVALNCVANGKIFKDGRFSGMWIQPAAGDAGGALGAALVGHYCARGAVRITGSDRMKGAFLGPSYSQSLVHEELVRLRAVFHPLPAEALLHKSAEFLAEGKVLAWFQGRMEFGPRSLGARSILADPRSPLMQSSLNQKIKFRESFRPFAPSVLREDVRDWFDLDTDTPYMLLTAEVTTANKEKLPAVTHVDGSARIQTVDRKIAPLFHALISKFKSITDCPVLVNTSFNVRGEPIVNTPAEAFRCFMGTDLDVLVIEDCILIKAEQDPLLQKSYHESLEAD